MLIERGVRVVKLALPSVNDLLLSRHFFAKLIKNLLESLNISDHSLRRSERSRINSFNCLQLVSKFKIDSLPITEGSHQIFELLNIRIRLIDRRFDINNLGERPHDYCHASSDVLNERRRVMRERIQVTEQIVDCHCALVDDIHNSLNRLAN